MSIDNPLLVSLMQQLAEWHQSRVNNCNVIIENTTADLSFPQLECSIPADSIEAKFFRLGVSVALQQFEPFPVVFNECDDDEDFDDE